MENTFKEQILKRINEIEVPSDLLTNTVPYIPLGKGVLLKKDEDEGMRLVNGILIPSPPRKFQNQARIVAMGPDCSDYLKVGISVKYNFMTDIETEIDGKFYVLNNEHSIEGIVLDSNRFIVHTKDSNVDFVRRKDHNLNMEKIINEKRRDHDNSEDERIEKSKDRKNNPLTSKYKR